MSGYELPFVLLMCGYNVAPWIEQTIQSVARQNYTNFRIVFVDDASEDNTINTIQSTLKTYDLTSKCTLISNKKRRRKLANMYDAIHTCHDNEIIVLLDGDDKLAHPYVLQKINETYQKHNCWFSYSNYKNEPKEEARKWGFREMGYSAPIPPKIQALQAYRYHTFIFMHLRSFYAWLFKQIKLEDLIATEIPGYEGDFFPASNDLAIVFPMVEMAKNKIQFIDEVLCIRNVAPAHIGFKVDNTLQIASTAEIRRKKRYIPLKKEQPAPITQKIGPIDACILFNGDTKNVIQTVYRLRKYCTNLRRIVVLCHKNTHTHAIIQTFKQSISVDIAFYDNETVIADALKQYSVKHKTSHILICSHIPTLQHPIHLKKAAHILAKTGALGFYYECERPPYGVSFLKTFAWKCCCNPKPWNQPHTLELALYPVTHICNALFNTSQHNVIKGIGLCL